MVWGKMLRGSVVQLRLSTAADFDVDLVNFFKYLRLPAIVRNLAEVNCFTKDTLMVIHTLQYGHGQEEFPPSVPGAIAIDLKSA